MKISNLFSNNLYGKLSSLQNLDLSSNYITGTIPMTIQLLYIIKYISLSSNSLIGSIPNGLLLIAKYSNLKEIYLNGNRLTGYIPDKLSDITDLKFTCLSDNDWYCNNGDILVDYSEWAKNTDYSSINSCIERPKHVLQSDIDPPIDLI